MKVKVSKQGDMRYLTAKLGWKEQFAPHEIEILSARLIPMLVSPRSVQGRKNNQISYDISAYSTMEYYLSYILSREQFANLILQCVQVFAEMQRMYLNYKNLILDFDKIYIQLSDSSLHFIYLPLHESKREASVQAFFVKLLKAAKCSTYEQVAFSNGCMEYLQRPALFVLQEFEAQVRMLSQVQPVVYQEQAAVQDTSNDRFYTPPANIPIDPQFMQQALSGEGTVKLGDVAPKKAPAVGYLCRIKTQERILIPFSPQPFMVGFDGAVANYHVADNDAVSHKHAQFFVQNDQYVMVDLASRNKSYLNQRPLTPGVTTPIKNGDSIWLADEAFTFLQAEV